MCICLCICVHMCLCTWEGVKEKEREADWTRKTLSIWENFFNFPLFILHSYYTQFCQEEWNDRNWYPWTSEMCWGYYSAKEISYFCRPHWLSPLSISLFLLGIEKTISWVQLLSHVWLFETPLTTVHLDSLSITNSWSLPKFMSIESVMPSNHLILCCPFLFLPSIIPSIRVFSNESVLHIRWPKDWVSASTSVLPMNTQDWSPLGWTRWISLQSKGLSGVFSNTTVLKHQFFSTQLSL